MLPEYQGAGALKPVSAVSRGPPCCELHSRHRREAREELGGGRRHLVSPASPKVSEKAHTPAHQHHLPRGKKSHAWPTGILPEIPSSASLSQ